MAPPKKEFSGCSKCGEKDLSKFHKSKKRHSWCRACINVYKREKQANGQPRAAAYQTVARGKKHKWLWDMKREKGGCETCGESDPCCLSFHHRDEATKSFQIGSQVHLCGKERLLGEMDKCVLLCENCHRKLHYYSSTGNDGRRKHAHKQTRLAGTVGQNLESAHNPSQDT